MNNEALKKKIVEIVLNSEITGIQIRNITGGVSTASSIADTLTAAGLTFDGEWKHKFEVAQKKLEKWQNIYFLALKNAIKFYGIELCPIECPFQYNFCGSDDCINLLAENFMQQAEKELVEEK